MQVDVLAHGLSPCRSCRKPVPSPADLLHRELFHVSRCPHCGVRNPHPLELAQWVHTVRTAVYGGAVLVASLAAILVVPVERWL